MLNKQLSELSKQFSEIVKYEVSSIKKQEEITDKIWEILVDENNGENIKVEEMTNNGGCYHVFSPRLSDLLPLSVNDKRFRLPRIGD